MPGIINPYLSVDAVIFGFDSNTLNVLLVERTLKSKEGKKTIFSDFSLTGNHVFEKEDIDDAALRVLSELTGMQNVYLEQFKTFAGIHRLKSENDQLWLKSIGLNPDSRIVSVGYYALVNCNNVTLTLSDRKVFWHPVYSLKTLAFDHMQIVHDALHELRGRMRIDPIGFELLPSKFTLSELQMVYELVFNKTLDKRNFRRKISRMKYLVPLREKQKGVSHKPAQLYMFSRDVYEITRNDFFDFFV